MEPTPSASAIGRASLRWHDACERDDMGDLDEFDFAAALFDKADRQ